MSLREVRSSDVAGPMESPLAMHELLGNSVFRSALSAGTAVGTSMLDAFAEGEGLDTYDDPLLETCELHQEVEDSEFVAERSSGGGVQILVGGPYSDDKGRHRYGHTAVRVYDGEGTRDEVFDFGRYGETRGDFSAEGEGVLRVWDDSFDEYMALQNSKGRETTGYTFPATPEEVERAFGMFDASVDEAQERVVKGRASGIRRDFTLPDDYHGIHNNCTTVSVDALEQARPDIDLDITEQNQGRGMNAAERFAAHRVEGWNEEIFMPLDLAEVLREQASEDVFVEHWDPESEAYDVLNEPGMTCAQPALDDASDG